MANLALIESGRAAGRGKGCMAGRCAFGAQRRLGGHGRDVLIRPDYPMGDAVYKSTDAGLTWGHMGLAKTGHIGRVVIDPQNPNRVFVCAWGQFFRPQHERGIFRTLDGGSGSDLGPTSGDLAANQFYRQCRRTGEWRHNAARLYTSRRRVRTLPSQF